MSQPQVTLFLTTYNWPEALALVLQSISQQTTLPDEVIIADDGSGAATKKVIDQYRELLPFPLIHCWQEDKGYRINAVRNKAIAQANNPYIIQIDGDIILDKNFIADHLNFAKKGRLIIGRRQQISKNKSLVFCDKKGYTPIKSFRNKLIAILHHHFLYDSTSIKGVRGCNMAYWKEDAITVNGYDEDWIGKGPDDKDFAVRLIHAGIKAYNLKFYALANHLYHGDEGLRDNYGKNQKLYSETLKTRKTKCKNGLTKIS
ncbi:MAG: glycosyltransferase family 2 protein [Marinilabiliaceae bacterium]|nr:glycosyltransferase family 2 protein [Marinilabiliaceae bacterium]